MTMEKVGSFLLVILLITSSIFALFIFFRDSLYIIKGDSMLPTLVNGDLIITVEKPPDEIIAGELNGDIVVIKRGSNSYVEYGGATLFYNTSENHNIIHRVVDKRYLNNSWFFLTKGDNNRYCDGGIREIFKDSSGNYSLYEYNASELVYIPQSEIIGVMVFKIPFLGLLKDFGLIILIPLIFIFCFLLFLDLLKRRLILIRYQQKKKIYRSKIFIILIVLLTGQLIFYFSISQFYFMNNESMEPYLKNNDLLIIKNEPASQIQVGDICIIRSPEYFYSHGFDPQWWNYYPNSSYLVHRILDKKDFNGTWYFMTGGDKSSIHIDGMLQNLEKSETYLLVEFNRSNIIYIPESEIIGVVIANIPYVGYLVDLMPYLLILLIILNITNIIFFKIRRSIRLINNFE
jgi:signal peptidase I